MEIFLLETIQWFANRIVLSKFMEFLFLQIDQFYQLA